MESVVELLQELIRIPSVNPDGKPGTDQVGEAACAEWVGKWLLRCGAEVEFDEVLPNRPNVIGRFASPRRDSGKPRILFGPHLDTVSIAGMTIDPFGGEVRDGRVWGRGASDTKGTMAAMLWSFWQLRDRFKDLEAEIGFVGLMGEETGQQGSQHFVKNHGDEYDFAIVGEPTSCDVVYTHKGCVWVEVKSRGRAAHGSTPHRGENAILKLNEMLATILPQLGQRFSQFEDPILGEPTVNLGMLNGGTRTNIVPDSATATLDIRETPALVAKGGGIAVLREILQENGWGDAAELRVIVESSPLATDPDLEPIQRLKSMGSELVMAPWFCDAGWLAKGGLPSIACGPGDIAQAHTEDEFIEIAELKRGADYYQKFIESYLIK